MRQLVPYATLTVLGCGGVSSRDAWKEVITKCAQDQKVGNSTLFFGLDNTLGVGTMYVRTADKAYALAYGFEDVVPDAAKRATLVHINQPVGCKAVTTTSFQGSLSAELTDKLLPVSPDLKLQLSNAKSVNVSIGGYAWDELKTDLMTSEVTSSRASDDPIRRAFLDPRHFTAIYALKVTGLKADLTFDGTAAADIAAKWNGKLSTPGGGDAGLTLSKKSDDTLELTTTSDAYIGVNLDTFSLDGAAAGGVTAHPATVDANPKVTDGRKAVQ
jgi:hypothetical protein